MPLIAVDSNSPTDEPGVTSEPREYSPSREFRFAVVMYGGVSLAIYIYGASRELFNLVRATAPATPDGDGGLAFPELKSTDSLYRRLAQIVGTSHCENVSDDAPVRCRFVVDILSGTSAGGINGVCLATALAADRSGAETSLEDLEELWLDEGDLGRLVADERSLWEYGPDRLPKPDGLGGEKTDPRLAFETGASLLNPRRLLVALTDVLQKMAPISGEDVACRSRLVNELDLWVTATDLDGRAVRLPLANATAVEAEHATRFHFRYDRDTGENDFGPKSIPFLGFAGRCTSSFPVAFEPMSLRTIPPAWPLEAEWSRFYPAYKGVSPEFPARFLSDGGILDNKPFSYATESLATRRSPLPVLRRLLYIEPDPGGVAQSKPGWDVVDTALAALTAIPRSETIQADIDAVLRRNLEIERSQEVLALAGLGDATTRQRLSDFIEGTQRLQLSDWLQLTTGELLEHRADLGPTYALYHRLKVRGVVDYLAGCLAASLGRDESSDLATALRYVVRAWLRDRYEVEDDPYTPPKGLPPRKTENAFLYEFDVTYRVRRLSYLLQRLQEFQLDDTQATTRNLALAGLLIETLPSPSEGTREEVFGRIRSDLSHALASLTVVQRRLRSERATADASLTVVLGEAGIDSSWLLGLLTARDDAARVDEAAARVPAPPEGFPPLDRLRGQIEQATREAREIIDEPPFVLGLPIMSRRDSGEDVIRDLRSAVTYVLRFHFEAFEALDLVLLPLSFGTRVAETNPVAIHRISPRDSHVAIPGVTKSNLMGARIHHFGGFFDRSWRAHDIAWGRINTAETLIRSVLGDDDPRAIGLIQEAHQMIIKEYRDTFPEQGAPAADGWLGGVPMPAGPDAVQIADTLRRAGLAAGEVASHVVRRRTGGEGTASATVALAREILPPNRSGLPAVMLTLSRLRRLVRPLWIAIATAALVVPVVALAILALAFGSGVLAWIAGLVGTFELGVLVGALAVVVAGLWIAIAKAHKFILKRLAKELGGIP